MPPVRRPPSEQLPFYALSGFFYRGVRCHTGHRVGPGAFASGYGDPRAAFLNASAGQSEGVLQLPATVCGLEVPAPVNTPPAGTPTVIYALVLCFEKQGGTSVIEPQTYQYYLELQNRVSIPSQNKWVPYTEELEQIVLGDFKRLWATNFLDDLSIDVRDVALGNGVTGKLVVYSMEERQRIKIVDYIGSDKIDQGKIDEELKKRGIRLNLDSFIDPGLVRRVAGIVREVYAEKGYMFAEVKPTVKEVAGGPKLVHLTFNINEGPQVKIRDTEFIGNVAVSDGKLNKQMKENKAARLLLVHPRRRHLQGRQVRRGCGQRPELLP